MRWCLEMGQMVAMIAGVYYATMYGMNRMCYGVWTRCWHRQTHYILLPVEVYGAEVLVDVCNTCSTWLVMLKQPTPCTLEPWDE